MGKIQLEPASIFTVYTPTELFGFAAQESGLGVKAVIVFIFPAITSIEVILFDSSL